MKKSTFGGRTEPAPPGQYVEALQETIRRQTAELDRVWAENALLKLNLRDERRDATRLRKQLAEASPCPALDAWVMEGREGRTWETGRTGGRSSVMLRASGGPAGGTDRAYGATPDAARAAMAQALSTEHLKSICPDGGENVCEHGDHPAPDGKRFCSDECRRCEHESEDEETGCDGICEKKDRAKKG